MRKESKFTAGDEVWFLMGCRVASGVVVEYHEPTKAYDIEMEDCNVFVDETDLFSSEQDLINSL